MSSGVESESVWIDGLRYRGLSQLQLSGLADNWLRESRDKIRALVTQICPWGPMDKLLIHLLPAETVKTGAHLEVPMALACLALLAEPPLSAKSEELLRRHCFVGSLDLSGRLQSTGVCAALEDADPQGTVGPAKFETLKELWAALRKGDELTRPRRETSVVKLHRPQGERVIVHGRFWEKFWLLAAAVAELPALLLGPPGTGKSTLARWAHRLMPEPSRDVLFEQRQIWNIASLRPPNGLPLLTPHSRSHLAEFIGIQNRGVSRPGYFSLAHGGLLVLDEFLEMNRDCREILRNILDHARVHRAGGEGPASWPANFWLIATSNPCPCGYARGQDLSRCRCGEILRRQYHARLSGPLFERFGVRVYVDRDESKREAGIGEFFDQKLLVDDVPVDLAALVAQSRPRCRELFEDSLAMVRAEPASRQFSYREIKNKARLLSAVRSLTPHDPHELCDLVVLRTDLEDNSFGTLGSPLVQETL